MKQNFFRIAFSLCLCVFVVNLFAEDDFAALQAKAVSFVLPNGLTVILYPRGEAPVISCVTYVKTGSADEPAGLTGAAHLLERLAFKGTPRIGVDDPNQYAEVIADNGGEGLGALASADSTVYQVSLPADKLEVWAALESDRFMNTVPRQFEKEKLAALEERRARTEANAHDRLYEALLGAAFQTHPYGVSVIGRRADILQYTREKVLGFYRQHYVPGNTVIAVVGGLDVPAAQKIITDYFARLPAAPVPQPPVAVEPAQDGGRSVEVEFPSPPALLLAYHVPARDQAETPALSLLEELAAVRLDTGLVKAGKAAAAGVLLRPGARFPRLLIFSAEPLEGGGVGELETNLLAEIDKLKTQTPSSEEMRRAATCYRARMLRSLRSNPGLAQALADYQALNGDWRGLFREIQRTGAVQPEQLTAVAKKYLTAQNHTAARIISTLPPSPPAETGSILGVPLKNDK